MAVDFGKQMGPLPLGAWIAVVVGGLGIAWYTKNAGTKEPQIVEDTSGVPGVGDGSVGGWTPTTPGPVTGPQTNVTNNDEWYQYIARELIGRWNYDPNLVDSALRKYISGLTGSLSVSEWVVIRAALSIMPPPQPIPAMPDDPSPTPVTPGGVSIPKPPGFQPPFKPKPPASVPTPKPPAPKPRVRYYTVKSGDNLWNIAKHYYGSGMKYGIIFDANRYGKRRADGTTGMIVHPNLIHPGWKLIIP